MLQTHEDGNRNPIRYLLRSLNDAERNYFASKLECLAVVWTLQTLRPYLKYEKLTVLADHHALNWLFKITEPSGRLTRGDYYSPNLIS